jgi:hypothetical protein
MIDYLISPFNYKGHTSKIATNLYSEAREFLSFLRHYATSRKVAESNPDEVDFFFSIYLILPAALWP